MKTFQNLKYDNLSALADRVARFAVTEKDRTVVRQLYEFVKEARNAQYRDFQYDVLTLTNNNYDVTKDRTTSEFCRVLIDSIVPLVEYDPSRDRKVNALVAIDELQKHGFVCSEYGDWAVCMKPIGNELTLYVFNKYYKEAEPFFTTSKRELPGITAEDIEAAVYEHSECYLAMYCTVDKDDIFEAEGYVFEVTATQIKQRIHNDWRQAECQIEYTFENGIIQERVPDM